MKQQFPDYTPDRVADYLKHYAEQREAPDPNNTWGHGFAVLPPPDDTEPPPGFDTSCGQTLTADSTVSGQWTTGCNSETPAPGSGSGARLARYYTFTLAESADVSVILESDDAETVLYLREGAGVRSGEPIEANDGESDYNYRRASIQRSLATGTYTIEATTYNVGETGEFTLNLSATGGTTTPPPVSGDCDIANVPTDGSPQSGAWASDCQSELTPGHNARYYTFTLGAAADVTITLEADDDEPVLHLRDGASKTGTEVHKNEGIGPDYLRAEIMENLDAGTYTIEARTYREGYEGPFTLTVSVDGAAPPPVSGDCGIADIATDGIPVTGSWSNDCQSEVTSDRNARYYKFTLAEDAEVTIELKADADEPVLHLRDGDSKTGTEIDKHEGFSDEGYKRAEIVKELEAGKTYTIEARTYREGYEGPFTLTVTVAGGTAPPPVSGDCGITEITDYGIPVTGSWSNDCQSEVTSDRNARYYTFTLAEDAEVTIELRADADEPVLHLRDGDSKTGTEIDKHEGFSDEGYKRAEIVKELEAGKTYTIEARTYREGYEGPFTLTVTVAGGTAPPPVSGDCGITEITDYGIPVTGSWSNDCQSEVTSDRNARYYTFTLAEDAEVTIELRADAAEPVLHLREGESKTGSEIAKHEGFQDEGYKRAEIVQDLEAGKTYTIEARTYSEGYEGPFTLTLRADGAAPPPEIVFAEPNWRSVQLQTYIARYMMENGYGYPTRSVPGSSEDLTQALASGDIHVLMEVWLPNQSHIWEPVLQAGEVISLGTSLGNDWQSAFVIPAYLQQQYPELDSVEDLKEQQYKALFQTAETGGKARLVSCPVGWNCEGINRQQVTGHGLDDHVHIVNPDSEDALYASLNDAYQGQEPWLGYMWGTANPALLLDLARLEEPSYSDGCWETTKACAYDDATILIGAHSSLPDIAPDVAEFLRNWDFPLDPHLKSVTRWRANNSDASIEDTGLYWLRNNEDTWSGWVTSEAADRIRAALSGS